MEYGVDELSALFSSEDWEELYGFVDIIDDLAGQERYDTSWSEWAEAQGKQTAEQWRQYFERVVRPQWLRDPASKREEIKKRVMSKHDDNSSTQSSKPSQQQQDLHQAEVLAESAAVVSPQMAVPKTNKPDQVEVEDFENMLIARRDQSVPAAYTFYAREKKWSMWNAEPSLSYSKSEVGADIRHY